MGEADNAARGASVLFRIVAILLRDLLLLIASGISSLSSSQDAPK
jgi:hypothetical protein